MNGDRDTSRPVPLPGGVPGRRRVRLEEAAADLRIARDGLLGVSHPRETRAYLEAMRSCVTDIAEITGEDAGAVPPPPAPGPGEAVPAGSDVLAACGHGLDAVDQLPLGIADAGRFAARQAGWGEEAFAASRAMVRLLLADRAAVDASSHELQQATAAYLTHPPATTAPGGEETVRRDGDSTSGAGGAG